MKQQQGDGLKDIFKKRKAGLLPPDARRVLDQVQGEAIRSIKVVRTPLSNIINKVLNVISLGAFQSALKSLGYDKAFHLTLWINDRITLEKNEVVRLRLSNPIKKGSEIMTVPIRASITVSELIDKTRSRMGNANFSNYDAQRNNCQDFLINILEANGLATPDIITFIKQDAESIFRKMPKWVDKFSKAATDIAAVGSRLIEGEGKTNKVKSKADKAPKVSKAPKAPKAPSKWVMAIKQYSVETGQKYKIPKKNTPEYEEILKIFNSSHS